MTNYSHQNLIYDGTDGGIVAISTPWTYQGSAPARSKLRVQSLKSRSGGISLTTHALDNTSRLHVRYQLIIACGTAGESHVTHSIAPGLRQGMQGEGERERAVPHRHAACEAQAPEHRNHRNANRAHAQHETISQVDANAV